MGAQLKETSSNHNYLTRRRNSPALRYNLPGYFASLCPPLRTSLPPPQRATEQKGTTIKPLLPMCMLTLLCLAALLLAVENQKSAARAHPSRQQPRIRGLALRRQRSGPKTGRSGKSSGCPEKKATLDLGNKVTLKLVLIPAWHRSS